MSGSIPDDRYRAFYAGGNRRIIEREIRHSVEFTEHTNRLMAVMIKLRLPRYLEYTPRRRFLDILRRQLFAIDNPDATFTVTGIVEKGKTRYCEIRFDDEYEMLYLLKSNG